MSLYLGDQLISGVSTPVQGRVLGQIIQSLIPVNDAGLHLADGSTISGTGSYSDFYNYMENLYNNSNTTYKNGYLLGAIVNNNTPYLTNNNYVFSGFSSNNYIRIPERKGRIDGSEYIVKFTTGSDVTTAQVILHSENFIAVEINTSGYLFSWDWTTSASKNILQVSANTTYWLKIQISGTTRTFFTSTDGINYTQQLSYIDTEINISDNYECRLGLSSSNNNNPFLGSIDLNETYIRANNKYAWKGVITTKNCFIEQDDYIYLYENYGSCGKFVIDTVNKTIRLPYIDNIIQGTTNVSELGKLIEPGLPNIVGSLYSVYTSNRPDEGGESATGAFGVGTSNNVSRDGGGSASDAEYGFNFDASRSSSIYGNSDTVQPQTVKVYYYIVIATLTKTEIEVDIDEIASDLNGKADKDLANITYGSLRNALDADSVTYIVGVYRNGYSWHNIYSDKFVEQGGMLTPSGSAGYKEINLLVEMADTNFDVYTTRAAEGTTTNYNVWAQAPYYTNSTTSIKVYVSNVNAMVFWRVAGRAK